MSAASIRVLAGDTGGTNTRLAVFDGASVAPGASELKLVAEGRFPSPGSSGLSEIVLRFLGECGLRPDRATFGVAGPVRGGKVRATNLPWEVDAREVASAIGLPSVRLLNDLEANAWGLRALPAEAFVVLHDGAPGASGNAALISAGTGLGQAGLYWDGTSHRPFACEGGHSSFSPRTPLEFALLDHLSQRFGHVSWERVLSGPGLANVFRFLLRHHGAPEPAWVAEAERAGGLPAAISDAAVAGSDELCVQALDLFCGFYGAEAGNLALKVMATGGVWLGGGVAPRILPKLRTSRIVASFLDKGRMRPLLESIPVRVVNDDRAALLGAAWHAAFAGDTRSWN